jgi:hypothetical protein
VTDPTRSTDPTGSTEPAGSTDPTDSPNAPRSLIERLGLAFVAAVMAIVFGTLAVAAWVGGELFLAVMAGIGALMTIWAAGANLRRG